MCEVQVEVTAQATGAEQNGTVVEESEQPGLYSPRGLKDS